MTVPEPLTLHAALLRAFTTASAPGEPHQCLTENPQKAADIAARVTEAYVAAAEVRARGDERRRCISLLRTEAAVQRVIAAGLSGPRAEQAAAEAASYEAAIGVLTSRMHGLAAGPGENGAGSEAAIRADERKRCVVFLRGWSASARQRGELVASTTASWLANELDPLGPVMGAPAAGGTT